MTKIILLSGKQGSGKTTISKALIEQAKQLGFDYAGSMKFADTLYTLHEYILNKMETLTGKARAIKDGPLLQLLGTDWGRKTFGDNVWVDILKNKISEFDKTPSSAKRLIIIDDCRFENEFDAFPEALRVRLTCPEDVRKMRCASWRENTNHPSETGLDEYAQKSKFDLEFVTGGLFDQGVEIAVKLIITELQKDSWKELRK